MENARQSAEEEFREQFLAKLQENMKNAQTEFKELNRALKDIRFSNEKYEFLFMPSKRYRHYYEMIMEDFNEFLHFRLWKADWTHMCLTAYLQYIYHKAPL